MNKNLLIRITDNVKNGVKENSTKLALAVAGIASIGCVYFAGKAKGETTLDINFNNFDATNEPDSHHHYKLENKA